MKPTLLRSMPLIQVAMGLTQLALSCRTLMNSTVPTRNATATDKPVMEMLQYTLYTGFRNAQS